MTAFLGLEIGKRSIMTHQTALEVTGHNIANASTEGYTRQVPNIVTTRPWHAPVLTGNTGVGQLGTGVNVDEIQRLRDSFLDSQIRTESQTSGYWSMVQDSLSKIEVILNEPSDDGLRSVMDQFWQSWQDLSANPESEASRTVVAQRSMAMAEGFNHIYTQLTDLKDDLNATVKIKVDQINSIAQQVADLNQQILSITISGQQPNDLIDKRDLLIDQISQIAAVKTVNDKNGMIALQLGDRMLVQGVTYNELGTLQDKNGMHMVVWKDTQNKAKINNGELKGILDVRGKTKLDQDKNSSYKEIIGNMMDKLNAMAKTIIMRTNEVHRSGFTLNNIDNPDTTDLENGYPDGGDFFTIPDNVETIENWAACIQVSQEIQDDPKNIAAASYRTWDTDGNKVNFGDGSNALKIAQLKQDLNATQYDLETKNIDIDLTSNTPLQYLIDGGDGVKTIQIAAPSAYKDINSLAEALQQAMDDNNIPIQVMVDGDQLRFSSSTANNLEVIMPGSGITDIITSGLQNGEYQLKTTVSTPGASNAALTELQHYNQATASSIFGSGVIGTITNASTLDVNASIELTVTGVNTTTGEVKYSYVSHEYNRNGDYNRIPATGTGTLTLKYGAAPQSATIGSMTVNIDGLDTKNANDVAELTVGDKGVLNLTAATLAATDYQQLEVGYQYNTSNEIKNKFIFNDTVLDNQPAKGIHFFTLNDQKDSKDINDQQLYGKDYDGVLMLTTIGTLASSDPAAYFASYENTMEDDGTVQSVTVDDYWRSVTADVGVVSQESQRMVSNQETLLDQLETKRQSTSGVSLDEEMTNMIKFQHAYNAAARFITTIDEELQTIISNMGLVGK
ncbi:MAG: flagellar hook-associated protein FlgK [Syntrophomonas sp.]